MSVLTDPTAHTGTDTGSNGAMTELLDRLRVLSDAAWPPAGCTFDALPAAGLAEPDPVLAAPSVVPDEPAEGAVTCPVAGRPPDVWACDGVAAGPFVPPVSEAGSPLLAV